MSRIFGSRDIKYSFFNMKDLLYLVFSCFIFFCFSTLSLYARDILLCPSVCEADSLKKAVKLASSDDTIIIYAGVYPSPNVLIDKPLTLKGNGYPVLNGMGKKHILEVRANRVKIDGLILKNSGISDIEEFAGIYIENSTDCSIQNNRLIDVTYGIYLARVDRCQIKNNQIEGKGHGEVLGGNGIHLWYSHYVETKDNHVSYHRDGLYFEFSYNLNISKNHSKNNMRYGMHFMFSHDSIFEKNEFWGNLTGVAIMYSDRIQMNYNQFHESPKTSSLGLLLKEINDSTFMGNSIQQHAEGITMDSAAKNTFIRNKFIRNGLAIKIYGSCEQNTFSENDFIDNFFDVSTNTKENRNTFLGNFWNKYTGYDLNRDGYGDIIYRPVQVFSYWVTKYPEIVILFGAPMTKFIEVVEKALPYYKPYSTL